MSHKTLQTNGNFIDNVAKMKGKTHTHTHLGSRAERTALLH